jgi:hypothetical protein
MKDDTNKIDTYANSFKLRYLSKTKIFLITRVDIYPLIMEDAQA